MSVQPTVVELENQHLKKKVELLEQRISLLQEKIEKVEQYFEVSNNLRTELVKKKIERIEEFLNEQKDEIGKAQYNTMILGKCALIHCQKIEELEKKEIVKPKRQYNKKCNKDNNNEEGESNIFDYLKKL